MANDKINTLPLEWVRVFESAGRLGSFTAAADELGLTQAAVSQRIRNLENRLATQLFSRQARGVTLTIEGEAWLPYVGDALQSLNRSVEELFGKPLKNIVISASNSITQLWLPPRLLTLKNISNYQFSVTTMNIESDFIKANAVIEIRYGNGLWQDIRCHKLYNEALTPLVSPNLLSHVKEWNALPRIAVSGPRKGWQDWEYETQGVSAPIPKYRFDSFVSAHAAAIAGLGVVLGSLPLCKKEIENRSLVRVSRHTLTPDASYWMTAKKDKLSSTHWNNLVQHLCEA